MKRKVQEIRWAAISAIRANFDAEDTLTRLIEVSAEPDGAVVLHLSSPEAAAVVMHALWDRYDVLSDVHPEFGILVWVP